MLTILVIILNVIYISNKSRKIIPFYNNLNKYNETTKEYISIVEWNFFQADLYIGKPVQKIKNIAIVPLDSSYNIKLVVKNGEDGYDIKKSKTINNFTYIRDINEDNFIEYGIF